jgi:hypothetical protein
MLPQKSQHLFHANIGPDRADTQALTFGSRNGKYKLRNFVAIAEALHKGLLPLLRSWDVENYTQIRGAIRLLFRSPLFAFQ